MLLERPVRMRRRVEAARHRRLMARLAGPKLIVAFADAYPRAFFVEIGAHDGGENDHLREAIRAREWRGIMVEPVPFLFERLSASYGGLERVALENVAIAESDGRRRFYHPAPAPPHERERLPSWYDQLGSFRRETIASHAGAIPDIERRIVECEVECLTLASLLRRHGATRVDLLAIDTEGYDWEILRGLDLERPRPRLLVYEHFHLSADDRRAAREHVRERGYALLEEGMDTFCLDARIDDELTRRMRRLRPALRAMAAGEA